MPPELPNAAESMAAASPGVWPAERGSEPSDLVEEQAIINQPSKPIPTIWDEYIRSQRDLQARSARCVTVFSMLIVSVLMILPSRVGGIIGLWSDNVETSAGTIPLEGAGYFPHRPVGGTRTSG